MFFFVSIYKSIFTRKCHNYFLSKQKQLERRECGVVANELDRDILGSEFEL